MIGATLGRKKKKTLGESKEKKGHVSLKRTGEKDTRGMGEGLSMERYQDKGIGQRKGSYGGGTLNFKKKKKNQGGGETYQGHKGASNVIHI